MGERCHIMSEIADALEAEEEHRRWAEENISYNCANCKKIQQLQAQVNYWKNKYNTITSIEKLFTPKTRILRK